MRELEAAPSWPTEFTARPVRSFKARSDARLDAAIWWIGRVLHSKTRLPGRCRLLRGNPSPGLRSMGKPPLPILNCKTERKAGAKNGRFGKKVENILAEARLTHRPGKLGCFG